MKIITTLKNLKFIDILKFFWKVFLKWGKDFGVLILYMIMVCGITFGLLILIYLLAPKEAYVYLTYDNDYELDYVKAKMLLINKKIYDDNFIESLFAFNDETEIIFNGFNVIYDDVVYRGDEYNLKFIPGKTFGIEDFDGDYSDFSTICNVAFNFESSSDKDSNVNWYFINVDNEANPNKFHSGNYFIYSHGYVTLETSSMDMENIKINLYYTNGILLMENIDSREAIEIESERIEFVLGDYSSYYRIGLNGSCLYPVYKTQSLSKDLQFDYIKEVKMKLYGKLEFSYSPTPNIYSPRNQSIYLKSDDYNIESGFRDSGYQLSGMVTEATLSEMDLFPSFYGWYRDNVLLAPLTLITIIFGGITLMINNRKK